MKRLAIVAALIAVVALSVDFLGDLTQTRADDLDNDTVSELVMSVSQDRFGGGRDAAAGALWSVCYAQTSSDMAGEQGLEPLGGGRYRAVLHPALGEHDGRQLIGCLEDLTVDRVIADVESVRTLPAAPYLEGPR
jgi:hypothetical protein